MATTHSCDKCGNNIKDYTVSKNMIKVPKLEIIVSTQKSIPSAFSVDLCAGCLVDLRVHLGVETVDREAE